MATLNDVIAAIKEQKHELITQYLLSQPELILETDEDENYLTHVVAQYGNPETLQAVYQALTTYSRTDLFGMFNNQGDSPLHLAAKFNNAKIVDTIINIDLEMMRRCAKTINKQDYLPIHCAQQNEDKDAIEKLLAPLILHQMVISLQQSIDTEQLLQQYNVTSNSELKENLTIAAKIVNEVRTVILRSPTHPSEQSDKKDRDALHATNLKLRQATKQQAQQLDIKDEKNKKIEEIKFRAKAIEQSHLGACEEFAILALDRLHRDVPTKNGELFNILDGDHVFLVIGRDPTSDINDYHTWGNAVVCDAWSGEVFLATQIDDRLQDHYKFENTNIAAPINPKVHKLSLFFSLPGTPTTVSETAADRFRKLK